MTNASHKDVLDRDVAKVLASDLVQVTSPLLTEVVNHATWAFVRCQLEATGEVGVDFPPFILYRQVIELTDAVEVLLANSCVSPAVPLIRSSFESSLGLEFILSDSPEEFRRRARSWLCVYIHKRLDLYDLVGSDRKIPRRRRKGGATAETITAGLTKSNLAKALAEPDMVPIEAEYQKTITGRRKDPSWYSLFGGPDNLRQLAKLLGQEEYYARLYKPWSTYSHAGDASSGFSESIAGGVAFTSLRSPERILPLARLAALFQVSATRMMIEKYRNGESLETWWLQEVKPKLEALGALKGETLEDG